MHIYIYIYVSMYTYIYISRTKLDTTLDKRFAEATDALPEAPKAFRYTCYARIHIPIVCIDMYAGKCIHVCIYIYIYIYAHIEYMLYSG